LRKDILNAAFTMAKSCALCHGATMLKPDPRAGGCFLTLLILAGFVAGLAYGNPMAGVLAGTGAGALVALLVWLGDRRR
jgi:hypothetical protein